jgi:hypothetical protein
MDFGAVITFFAIAAYLVRSKGVPGYDLRWAFGSVAIGTGFFFATMETSMVLGSFWPEFHDGGVSVVWSLFALALIVSGLVWQVRGLRWTGLVLFGVVGLKAFLLDLAFLKLYYRFLALVLLGIIALTGSLLYMRAQAFLEARELRRTPEEAEEPV